MAIRSYLKKETHLKVRENQQNNLERKRVRSILKLNASEIKDHQIKTAYNNLQKLKSRAKRARKFNILLYLYKTIKTFKEERYDVRIEEYRYEQKR